MAGSTTHAWKNCVFTHPSPPFSLRLSLTLISSTKDATSSMQSSLWLHNSQDWTSWHLPPSHRPHTISRTLLGTQFGDSSVCKISTSPKILPLLIIHEISSFSFVNAKMHYNLTPRKKFCAFVNSNNHYTCLRAPCAVIL